MRELLNKLLETYAGVGLETPMVLPALLLVILVIAVAAYYIVRYFALKFIAFFTFKTKTELDDILLGKKVFNKLCWFVPALVVHFLASSLLNPQSETLLLTLNAVYVYMIIAAYLTVDAFLNGLVDFFESSGSSKEIPIKSFVQVLKVLGFLFCGVLIISVILNKTPLYLLSGLGALTAVMMLVFKDAILGLVAGVQLTANKMVAKGDWISMPQYGADGDVIEVALTTVKVQNWDKTVTTIPTYSLISQSFKNWRPMFSSGGRRIKRSLNIDMNTIKFCDEKMLSEFENVQCLNEYLKQKKEEVAKHNSELGIDETSIVNGRHLTNVGTFRAYIVSYLKNHPMINKEMTFLVRHLQPGPEGLPIQIYVFSSDTAWVNYEGIQADIFDHLLAALPEFCLKPFQHPSSNDFQTFLTSSASK